MKRYAMAAVCVALSAATSGGCLFLKQAPRAQTEAKVPVLDTWAKLNAENAGAVRDNWVETFNDATLTALVKEALENNRDIQAAAARRDQAIALAKRAGAAFWPTLDLSAGAVDGGGLAADSAFLTGLANWEIDLWGRVRYLTRSARADAGAAEADLEFVKQSIAAQVAQTYYLAIANRLRLENTQVQLKIQEEIDRIQQVKTKEGQAFKYEAELSKADLAKFRADLEDRQASLDESLRALEVLLGRYPSAEMETATALPASPGPVPAGLPSELLERRPDIIAAEQALASAFYQTESTKTNLLPRLALTGEGGYASEYLNGLLNRHRALWSGGIALAQPLFDAGARFADIEAARAVQRETIAQYGSIVLNAFREVQNALANEVYFRNLSTQLQLSSASMDVALPLSQTLYKAGDQRMTLLNFKQVQTQAYQTKDAAISAQYSLIQQRIELHRALGGSILLPAAGVPATQPAGGPATQPAAKQ